MQKTSNTSRRTTPTSTDAAHEKAHVAERDTEPLDARDVMRRPAAFFGLSEYATDPASRLARGPLAYLPI